MTSAIALLLVWGSDQLLPLFLGRTGETVIDPLWLWLSFATIPGLHLSAMLGSILVVDNRTRLYFVWNMLGQLFRVALTWLMLVPLKLGIVGALLANLAVQLLPIGVLGYWLRLLGETGRASKPWQALTHMLGIGLPQYSVTLLASIFKRGEIILVALLLDLRSVGFYAVAMAFYDLLVDIPRSFVWPIAGRFVDTNSTKEKLATTHLIRLQILSASGLAVGMAFLGPLLIPIAYGKAFEVAVLPFLIMLPGIPFRSIHLGVSAYFIGEGRPGAMMPAVAAAASVNLALDIILIPRFAMIGAAAATVAAEVCMAIISILVFVRNSGISMGDAFLPRLSDISRLTHVVVASLKRAQEA